MAEKIRGRGQRCTQPRREVGRDGYRYDALRVNTDENAVNWVFHRATDARWRWKKTSQASGIIAESAASYSSYVDCVADAEGHGYKKWLVAASLTPLSFPDAAEPLSRPLGQAGAKRSSATAASSLTSNVLKLVPLRGNGAR